jgi:hypothetical protein
MLPTPEISSRKIGVQAVGHVEQDIAHEVDAATLMICPPSRTLR